MMMMEGKTMIIKAIDDDDEGDDNDYQSQVRRKTATLGFLRYCARVGEHAVIAEQT